MAGGAGRGAGGGMKEAPTEAGAEVDGDSLNTPNLPDPAAPSELNPLLTAARGYLARELVPIRLSPGQKVPPGKHDANTVTADNAAVLLCAVNFNLGLRLGAEGGALVDFDLDWPQARRVAARMLGALPSFGRATARGSHYLFRCPGFAKTVKFDIPELKGVAGLPDEHAVCVLEVRGKGHTMAPPSAHPNGEAVEWERDVGLLEMSAGDALRRAGLIAFLSVVARFYPGKGDRDDFCLPLSGALLAAGLSVEEANQAVVLVAEIAGDEEAAKRGKASQTAAKADAGEPVTGIPRVVEKLGLPPEVAKRFRRWLGIADGRADDRPEVIYDENRMGRVLDEAEAALLASGIPLYQQYGRLVHSIRLDSVQEDEHGVRRRAGALLVREPTSHRLLERMTDAANFVEIKVDKKGEEYKRGIAPPLSFAHHYEGRVGVWRLPVLRGVTETPTLRPDGTVLSADGYDAASGLILDTRGVIFPPVPDEPTHGDAVAAMEVLKGVIEGFPFVDDAARSVALSAILTAVCRRAIRTAPLHGFSAPTMGTGKSLLAEVVSMIVTGRAPSVMNQSSSEEEDKKRLLSVLMQGDPVLVIDNITRPVTGEALCSVLTQETWQERRLGANTNQIVNTNALFIANGNNLEFREDMSTRAILCVMDARMERPETRPFDVDLRVEVPRRQGELVAAALTVLRAFVVAGRPGLDKLETFGRFEEWSDLVRGALVWAGEADPCDTRRLVAVGDSAREELVVLVDAWEAAVGIGKEVTAQNLIDTAGHPMDGAGGDETLRAALEGICPNRLTAKALGTRLRPFLGKVVRGLHIRRIEDADKSGSAAYALSRVSEGP